MVLNRMAHDPMAEDKWAPTAVVKFVQSEVLSIVAEIELEIFLHFNRVFWLWIDFLSKL